MKWFMGIAAVLTLPALAFGNASFTLTSGGNSAITIDPNDSFVVDVAIVMDGTTTTNCQGFDMALIVTDGNDLFKQTSQSIAIKYFGPTSDDKSLFTVNPLLKTAALAGQNLGGTYTYSAYPGWSASPLAITAVTVQAQASAVAGTYTVSLDGPGAASLNILDQTGAFAVVGAAPTLSVTITPEPASMLLLVGALPFLRRRR